MPLKKKSIITLDKAQQEIAEKLESLRVQLEKKSLFKRRAGQGIYIYGDVGRGKSMLMYQFFDAVEIKNKRRVHFHSFMQEVHRSIHALREEYKRSKKEADFLPRVAEAIAAEARLLCFDEFQVKDIADAMILSRFFELLFAEGVTVVATSNRPPEDLYKDGLKRENFLPFIDLLKSKLDILFLDSLQDYRRKKLGSLETTYFTPLGKKADAFIKNLFTELANGHKPEPQVLEVNGRELALPRTYAHVAWCSFEELCAQPLAAGDYLAIAEEFDTLLLENIPILSAAKRNEATRFITLIDVLYENKTKLICTAEAAPEELYKKGDNRFEFDRTISRLIEMQSSDYLK